MSEEEEVMRGNLERCSLSPSRACSPLHQNIKITRGRCHGRSEFRGIHKLKKIIKEEAASFANALMGDAIHGRRPLMKKITEWSALCSDDGCGIIVHFPPHP